MPLETATYIAGLVATNPASADGLNQADDHMRLIKSVLLGTFPNFTNAALNSTQAQLDNAVAQIAAIAANNSLVEPGALMDFGMPTAPAGWLACDGQAVSRTTFAALFTAIGTTWGAGDGTTTFNVPHMMSRFRRHRDTAGSNFAGAVGVTQAPANLAHTHTGSGVTGNENQNHTHDMSHTTGTENQSHTHSTPGFLNNGVAGGSTFVAYTAWANSGTSANFQTGTESAAHNHSFSGSTGLEQQAHTHNFSLTTSGGSADNANEARPFSVTVLTCIKT